MEPEWLKWAQRLQAISQTGLHYSQNEYDAERYREIRTIAAEILACHSTIEKDTFVAIFAKESGYATPKVDVRGAVFREDKILLVREVADDHLWTLPGGWADITESPSEAIVREIYEESGFQTSTVKLLALYDRAKHEHTPPFPYHVYKLFFRCEITGGQAAPSHETSEVSFFPETNIPELSTSRVTANQIKRFFYHYRNPSLPTDFD